MTVSIIRERPVSKHWRQLSSELNLDPVLARILSSRGVKSGSDLDYSLQHLIPSERLTGIQDAADRIIVAIERQEQIVIAGDYDTDGATASVLCVTLLKAFGAQHVDFAVPNRFNMGYGLTTKFVETLIPLKPKLIITVDNGIGSIEGVSLANAHGINVIITDHHLPPEELPPATAIVNPNMPDCEFGSQPAGVGVAFYVMMHVRKTLRQSGYFEKKGVSVPNLASCLDLVALGTIVDLVPLDRNNRLLVSQGLKRMQHGRTRPGIKALCDLSDVNIQKITEVHLGFQIGPRLNAAGRLVDMKVGILALLAEDYETAVEYALKLRRLNNKRKDLQFEMTQIALKAVKEILDTERRGICLFHHSFQEGVVGLVAGRIADEFHRPTIAFAPGKDTKNGVLKGSARSIVGIHVRDVLADIDTTYPHLIRSYGGHAMAAGLTIHCDSFERFANIFDSFVASRAPANAFDGVVYTDGELKDHHFSRDFIDRIKALGPWGQEFPKPTFHGTFRVVSQELTRNAKHLKLSLAQDEKLVEAIAFRQSEFVSDKVKIAFSPTVNTHYKKFNLQLVVEHIEQLAE